MGMYTHFQLAVEISDATAQSNPGLIPLLQAMVDGEAGRISGGEHIVPDDVPAKDHPFFSCARWGSLFVMSSYSHITFRSTLYREYIARAWWLTISSSSKNYDGEIEHFLDWIRPFLSSRSRMPCAGFIQYEQAEMPTLILDDSGVWVFTTPDWPAAVIVQARSTIVGQREQPKRLTRAERRG